MREKENWIRIDGKYEVSDYGRVRNYITNRFLTIKKTRQGYCIVNLNGRTRLVHRLVATTFVPNLFNEREVDHINGKKDDNRAVNLRWVSSSENKHFLSLCREKRKPHLNGVNQLDSDGNIIGHYSTLREAALAVGVHKQGIYDVCIGKNLTAGGYKWQYA